MQKRYLAIEGPDGSGKSTVVSLLKAKLVSMGYPAITISEPSARDVGLQVRELLATTPRAETVLPLLAIDRMEQADYIGECLSEGVFVIQDRSFLSSLVYQGERWQAATIMDLLPLSLPLPHIVVLNVSPETCFSRVQDRLKPIEFEESLERIKEAHGDYASYATSGVLQASHLRGKLRLTSVLGETCPDDVVAEVISRMRQWGMFNAS